MASRSTRPIDLDAADEEAQARRRRARPPRLPADRRPTGSTGCFIAIYIGVALELFWMRFLEAGASRSGSATSSCSRSASSSSARVRRTPVKALVLEEKHKLSLRDFPIEREETLGPRDVRIKLHTVGICGSDVHYYTHGAIGPFVVREPMILGHEASGTVIETGPEVKTLKVGDRVCMEPGIPDPDSRATRLGIYNVDPAVRFWATPPVHGILRPTVVHPELFTFKLPDNVSFAEAAMVEPLAVGVHGATKAAVKPGDIGLVIGAGPIGLVTALVAARRRLRPRLRLRRRRGQARPRRDARRRSRPVNVAPRGPRGDRPRRHRRLGRRRRRSNAPATRAARPASSSPLCPGGRVVFIGGQSEPDRLRRRRGDGARGARRARLPLRPRLPALHRHARLGRDRREAAHHPHLRLRRQRRGLRDRRLRARRAR